MEIVRIRGNDLRCGGVGFLGFFFGKDRVWTCGSLEALSCSMYYDTSAVLLKMALAVVLPQVFVQVVWICINPAPTWAGLQGRNKICPITPYDSSKGNCSAYFGGPGSPYNARALNSKLSQFQVP